MGVDARTGAAGASRRVLMVRRCDRRGDVPRLPPSHAGEAGAGRSPTGTDAAPDTVAWRIAVVELILLVGAVGLAIVAAGWTWLVPFAVAAPLFAVELWFDVRSRGRRLVPELCGAIGITAAAAAIVIAGDDRPVWLSRVGVWPLGRSPRSLSSARRSSASATTHPLAPPTPFRSPRRWPRSPRRSSTTGSSRAPRLWCCWRWAGGRSPPPGPACQDPRPASDGDGARRRRRHCCRCPCPHLIPSKGSTHVPHHVREHTRRHRHRRPLPGPPARASQPRLLLWRVAHDRRSLRQPRPRGRSRVAELTTDADAAFPGWTTMAARGSSITSKRPITATCGRSCPASVR